MFWNVGRILTRVRVLPTDTEVQSPDFPFLTTACLRVPLAAAERATTPFSRTRARAMETEPCLPPSVPNPAALSPHRYSPGLGTPPARAPAPAPGTARGTAPGTAPTSGPDRGSRASAAALRWAGWFGTDDDARTLVTGWQQALLLVCTNLG